MRDFALAPHQSSPLPRRKGGRERKEKEDASQSEILLSDLNQKLKKFFFPIYSVVIFVFKLKKDFKSRKVRFAKPEKSHRLVLPFI